MREAQRRQPLRAPTGPGQEPDRARLSLRTVAPSSRPEVNTSGPFGPEITEASAAGTMAVPARRARVSASRLTFADPTPMGVGSPNMTRTSFAPLRSLAIACALTGLALAFPVSGHAAQTFGSLLKNSPAPGPDPCVDTAPGPCTLVGYINPNDPGDPVTSPAPANGVIVRFRIRSLGAEAVTLRLATVTKQGDTILAQATRTGPTVTTQGTGEIEEFPARLQVVNGEQLALDAPSTRMVYNQGGDEYTPLYAPPLVEGQGPRGPGGGAHR